MTNRIRELLDQYALAVWNKDADAFLDLYDINIHTYDAWEKWEYAGIKEFSSLPVSWFKESPGERVRVTFMYPEIQESGALAAVWSQVVYSGYDEKDNLLHSLSNRLTMVMKKQGEHWKIVHEHTSVPVNKETGAGVFYNKTLIQDAEEQNLKNLPYNFPL